MMCMLPTRWGRGDSIHDLESSFGERTGATVGVEYGMVFEG